MIIPRTSSFSIRSLAATLCVLALWTVPGLLDSPARAVKAKETASLAVDTSDQRSLQARRFFVRGLTETYLEDYEAAVTNFNKALNLSPRHPAILIALADAEAGQDNYSSALYYAEKACEYSDSRSYYYRRLAELQRKTGNLSKAAQTYQSLLSQFPNDLTALLSYARLQSEMNAPKSALETYQTLLEKSEAPRPQAYIEMLELYRQVGDQQGLKHTLQTLIELREDDQLFRRLLGQLYTEQNRPQKAISLFEQLLKENPDDANLMSRLKRLYQKTGQDREAETLLQGLLHDDASADQLTAQARSLYQNSAPSTADSNVSQTTVKLLERALAQDSTHGPALNLLGTIYYERGNYAEAAPLLDRALDENPRDPERWRRAASSYLESDRADRAAELADEGRLLFPGRYDLTRVAAFAHLRLGHDEKALQRFQKALDLASEASLTKRDQASLYAGLGLVHSRLGHTDKAYSAYEQALDANPTQLMALNNYAYSLAEREVRLDRALELAQRALEQDPTNAAFLDTLGWVYFKQGKYRKAKTYIGKAIATGTATAIVYEHYGDVHRALGNEASARRYWQQALERAPERETLQEKINRIHQN